RPGHHHPVREPAEREHPGPEAGRDRGPGQPGRQQQRRQREHRQGHPVTAQAEPGHEQGGQRKQCEPYGASRSVQLPSLAASSAIRRPSARASLTSSSLVSGSSLSPAKWLAPYGVPPLRVVLRPGSVNGMPATTQPWCSSGSIIVSRVDSWPPCIVLVEVNTPAGLPTRVPLAHS